MTTDNPFSPSEEIAEIGLALYDRGLRGLADRLFLLQVRVRKIERALDEIVRDAQEEAKR